MIHASVIQNEQVTVMPTFSLKGLGQRAWSFLRNSIFVTTFRPDLTWEQFEKLESKKTIHSFRNF